MSWPVTRANRLKWKKARRRRRRLKGAPGRGTLETETPPLRGRIQRGAEVVLHLLAKLQPTPIQPVIEATIAQGIAQGTLLHTEAYDLSARLEDGGDHHKTVCPARGEDAREDDGDGFCGLHVNTLEGFWSGSRSWLRPHRGLSQEKLPADLGVFQCGHNARRRGEALRGTLGAALVS